MKSVAVAASALALLAPATHAVADDGHGPAPRAQLLARAGHGAAVVSALGDKLPAVAATNRMSATRLAHILESDSTAWLGRDGQLFYKEAAASVTLASSASPIAPASYPADQTFALHSNASSTHKVFLDFDGASVTDTWWNTQQGMPARDYSGFTLDSDPSFSTTELAYIQEVWRIVAEKYSPFDVDVTTQDPGPAGYNRSGATDTTYGDHVIITDDSGAVNGACGGSCSGAALVGTFDDSYYTGDYLEPAWVFSSMTSGSPVLTAHTAAHEVGHTLGLSHDGETTSTGTTDYSSGHNNWFPLMGSSANAVGQFSMGEYANANNQEDDLAVITRNGVAVRRDDVSDVTGQPLTTGTLFDGVISTRSDTDLFAVDHPCSTDLTARATGIGAGGSLDISVTVLRSDGTPIGSADPPSGQVTSVWPYEPTGMNASVTVAATSGTYYVRVDGVGHGNPVTDGYSDYASIGQYQLAVSTCDGTLPVSTTPTPVTTTPTGTTSRAGRPSAPGPGRASSGRRGHPVTATARWNTPASNGGTAIVGYRVRAERLSRSGRVVGAVSSRLVSARAHALTMRLPHGRYRFRVVAYNKAGASPISAPSRTVAAR